MNDDRYSKIALLGGVHGIRQTGRLLKCWIDSINEDCGALGITIIQAFTTSLDRNNWRTTINGLSIHA